MRQLLLSSAMALLGQAALADDIALVLGNTAYSNLGGLSRGADATVSTNGIAALGFDVTVLRDGRANDTAAALGTFLGKVPEADRMIVALTGRFATDGDRTWFLTADATSPSILTGRSDMVSVESVLDVLARAPGKALLLLGADAAEDDAYDPWLSEGIGDLDIPQGVTVLRGAPRDVADFMRNGLAQGGADLSDLVTRNGRLMPEGYFPQAFDFMPSGPVVVQPQPPATDTAADEALWRRVAAQDNVDAYRGYLLQFPNGIHADEAEAAVAAILAEPFRDERLAEEALALSRDQRRDIQGDLTTMGFNTRGIDGIFGQGTRRAITNWQQENGFAQTGYVTMEQIQRLDAQAARRTAEQAAEAERQRQEAERLDRAYWDETGARGDEAGLRAYLQRYPQGLYAEIAQDQLDLIAQQSAQANAARDREAWNSARSVDSAAAYRAYLRDFPRGNFIAEAQARIAALENQPSVPVVPEALNPENPEAAQIEAALNLNGLTARLVEQRLAAAGLDTGAVDGSFDNQTRRAIRQFQEANRLPVTGYLDQGTVVMLLAGALQ